MDIDIVYERFVAKYLMHRASYFTDFSYIEAIQYLMGVLNDRN